jgi:hypothetical protein
MNYTIISQNGNHTLISTVINGQTYQSLIVCSSEELQGAVDSFINSIQNPLQPK